MSERINTLREAVVSARPKIFIERALIVTEAYKETEGQASAIRRAKTLEKILGEIPICIRDGELIVGSKAAKPLGSQLYPEISLWIEKELDTIGTRGESPFFVSEENKRMLRKKALPYWRGKTLEDKMLDLTPKEVKDAWDEFVFTDYLLTRAPGHLDVDYEKVLEKGFNGIKGEVEDALSKVDYSDPDCVKKLYELRAMLICCDAAVNFARRHAVEARRLAKDEGDPQRKVELEKIADVCEWVPANPARTFQEALQSFWFTHLILALETNALAIGPGRFDQYMHPYMKGIKERKLTKEEAEELLMCLWIKFAEMTVAKQEGLAQWSNTYNDFQILALGGQTPDGKDAVNELSYICLDVTEKLRLTQPSVCVLISRKTNERFLLRACEVISKGFGMPAVFNDDAKITMSLRKGKTLEDARLGVPNGCVTPNVQGKEHMAETGYTNWAKYLELALNDGVCPQCGKQSGLKTGNPEKFTTFDDVVKAYRRQMEHFLKLKVVSNSINDRIFAEFCPVPYTSLMVSDCIEKGKDFHDGGAHYNLTHIDGVGLGTVADSLTAIKKLVFENRLITMPALLKALEANFEGKEEIRQMLINKAPKYGNDDPYADAVAKKVMDIYCDLLESFKHARARNPYGVALLSTTSHIPFGSVVGATPDGRKAGEPLSEGVSPVHSRKGPTAVLKSVASWDHSRVTSMVLNMKFNPQALRSKEDLKKFAELIRAYFNLGGYHIQFNVVSSDILRDAQKHPDRYRDLIVRVAAYSDYFVKLIPELQDEIIARTEYAELG